MRTRQFFISLALGLGLTLALLWLLGRATLPPAHAAASQCPDQRPLLQAGGVITVCLSGGCDYTSIQDAVDAADPGDEILVASGVYTSVQNVSSLNTATFTATQMLAITKTVTIRGGYNADFSAWDPDTYSTTLDAQGRGRVLYITGDISPTIEGLRIIGGDATGLGGWDDDAGGGVYIINATATISNSQVFSNTAYRGGGLYLYKSDATLNGNTMTANTASEHGGGLFLRSSNAILTANMVASNTAQGHGGGLLLCYHSNAKLMANTVVSNHAQYGGGITLNTESPTLNRNLIIANTASGNGGGLYSVSSSAILTTNIVASNTAQWNGGGLHLEYGYPILRGNTVLSNTAYSGGGLYLSKSDATLSGNTTQANTATSGGGLYMHLSDATLMNNVVAENQANTAGSGLYIRGSSPHLLHTTIARNSGGSGLYVTGYEYYRYYPSAVAMTNNVLVSHSTGIMVTAENMTTLEATLWGTDTWANEDDWGGAGNIFTGTVNIWGNPAFVNPDVGDYHIAAISAARDAGVNAGVTEDFEGESRPNDGFYDIGADEYYPHSALNVTKQAEPDVVQAEAQLTYTISVTNTGNVTLTATITDTLPDHVTTTQPLVWASQVITAPGGVWTEQVVVTVEMGYAGPLTNVVEVTTDEGATGTYTRTVTSTLRTCWARLNDDPTDYPTGQAAVDAANDGDMVKVAGYCAGVEGRAGVTQTVYISKTVTIRGGYTTTNWTVPYPITQPTTLDAQGQGRVLYITGDISPTIEGLHITGGDAAGLGGGRLFGCVDTCHVGGGVYVITATAIFSNNQIFENTADDGGGLFLRSSHAMLCNNVISSNTALFWGGGVFLQSSATLSGNTIITNTALSGGGGLLYFSHVILNGNTVVANSAHQGGGLLLGYSDTTLNNNTIFSNTATSEGGGVAMCRGSATLGSNTIISNSAGDDGGGLYFNGGGASLTGNIISLNSAGASGGGLFLHCSNVILTNTLIADNRTNTAGSGLYGRWCSSSSLRALHSTIARNTGGDGSGVYVTNWESNYSTVALTNTILVSQTVGITVTSGNTATLEATLWGTDTWANGTDWGGAGTIITGTRNYWGDPAFVDPDGGDYHISAMSTAVDKGVDAGVTTDIDGQSRDAIPDLGADEFYSASRCYARITSNPTITYTTVQAAVDAANDGDTVKVAGYCTGVETRAGVTQTVYISKTVTIRGGYTTTNWTVPYPITQPTTLDAQGQGRVLYITGDISPTIEGLHVTGGDAAGLGGAPWGWDSGGGVYVVTATATISNNQAFSNTAFFGGGVYVISGTVAISNSQVFSNTADYGGGLLLYYSDATLSNNAVISNTASDYDGGGLLLYYSDATLSNNTVISNTAKLEGGGLCMFYSNATLSNNTVISNTASNGGGLDLYYSDATLSGNTVTGNTADPYGGGGLFLYHSDATLSNNIVTANTAKLDGGGLALWYNAATLTNNVVADNQADRNGSGLYIFASSPRLLHTTIARNVGSSGVYITDWVSNYSTVALTNTILVSHTVGITVTGGNTVTVNGVLWYSTPITISQAATATVTVQNQHEGNPTFAPDGYHLTASSAAIDQGVDAGVTTDIDSDARPDGCFFDIGADEFITGVACEYIYYLPLIMHQYP